QLETDVGVDLVGSDFIQQLAVQLGAGASLVGVGDIFAQVVDRDRGSELIDRGCGTNRVPNLRSGDKTAGTPLADTGAFGDRAQTAALGKSNKERPQHGAPDCRGL